MSALAAFVLVAGGAAVGLAAYEVIVRVSGAGRASSPRRAPGRDRGSREGRSGEFGGFSLFAGGKLGRRVFGKALSLVGSAMGRAFPIQRDDAEELRASLARAGVSLEPETWRSARAIAAALAGAVGFAVFAAGAGWPAAAVAGGVGAAVGWLLPERWRAAREKTRREEIEAGLPDAMELLGIALAAGSPIEQCFREVAASLGGALAHELSLVDREVNLLGRSREDALAHLAQRCRSQEVSAFVAQLSQAISQGSSIGEGLALQAELARERAQADALERIRKMPTKLDVVLSVCFLPPTTVLVLVPTVVQLLGFLNDTMG